MIRFRVQSSEDEDLLPFYATSLSVAADLKSSESLILKAGEQKKVPTGLWIHNIDEHLIPSGQVIELQVRARSGLAYKHGITLTNGVGTIDGDYPDEICVLLWNTSSKDFPINRGDRIAQICAQFLPRLHVPIHQTLRSGGFGSTGIEKLSSHTSSPTHQITNSNH